MLLRMRWSTLTPGIPGWYGYCPKADVPWRISFWSSDALAKTVGLWCGPIELLDPKTQYKGGSSPQYSQQNYVVLDVTSKVVYAAYSRQQCWEWICEKATIEPMVIVHRKKLTPMQWNIWVETGGGRKPGRPAVIGVPITPESLPDPSPDEEPYVEDNSSEAWKKDPEDDKDK